MITLYRNGSDISKSPKAINYIEFKKKTRLESYLIHPQTKICKYRCFDVKLPTETGRWHIPRWERKCTLCDLDEIGDEYILVYEIKVFVIKMELSIAAIIRILQLTRQLLNNLMFYWRVYESLDGKKALLSVGIPQVNKQPKPDHIVHEFLSGLYDKLIQYNAFHMHWSNWLTSQILQFMMHEWVTILVTKQTVGSTNTLMSMGEPRLILELMRFVCSTWYLNTVVEKINNFPQKDRHFQTVVSINCLEFCRTTKSIVFFFVFFFFNSKRFLEWHISHISFVACQTAKCAYLCIWFLL